MVANSLKLALLFTLAVAAAPAAASDADLQQRLSALIPKRETRVLEFLEQHPEYDGRGTIIAIFDTGVDPAAQGLQVTTTGEPKIVDIIDASGAGDVDMATTATLSAEGTLEGRTGRTLVMPAGVVNPTGVFRIGWKPAEEIFGGGVRNRISAIKREKWEQEHSRVLAARLRQRDADEAAKLRPKQDADPAELTIEEQDLLARERQLEDLEAAEPDLDPAAVYDCVAWHDGTHWRAIVDTDEDGDLTDETVLRPYGIAHEYASFGDDAAGNFSIQVYDEGAVLSIVTVTGSHGSHVAAIAAAHFPDEPARNGVAPGARILSVRIGDARLGSASTLIGETRGVIACAQYGVDVMNASWGGSSPYQDGSDLGCQVYTKLARDYGVTCFVSAGNNGPALSTLGSPGGECPAVIGVGAYVSAEMAETLHAVLGGEGAGDVPYQFTSRGPTKGGDLGVDVFGPGGAIASTSFDSLTGATFMNGTSMSSPSVAGVGALLHSAAKQLGLKATPERVRAALMNSATQLKDVEVFAQGAGLVDAPAAFEHLRAWQDEKLFDLGWNINTGDNDALDGPGLYWRRQRLAGPHEVAFTLSPIFSGTEKNQAKFELDKDVILRPTVDWVRVPDYFKITNGTRAMRPVVTVAPNFENRSRLDFGEIHGLLANAPEAGPVFRIPLTLISPTVAGPETSYTDRWREELGPGGLTRRFHAVPEGATAMRVRLRLDPRTRNSRLFLFHAVSVRSGHSYGSTQKKSYNRLNPGQEVEFVFDVEGGRTTDLTLHQVFSSLGDSVVDVEAEFLGIRSYDSAAVLMPNEKYAVVEVHAPLKDIESSVSARIDEAYYTLLPAESEVVPLGERDVLPPWRKDFEERQLFRLQQKFEFALEEPGEVRVSTPEGQDRLSEALAGGLLQFFDESGALLFQGSSWRAGGIKLSKGKTTIWRIHQALDRGDLDAAQDHSLQLRMEVAKAPKLTVQRDRDGLSGKGISTLNLKKGRDEVLLLRDEAGEAARKHKPAPDFFRGALEFKQKDHTLLSIPVTYNPGGEFPPKKDRKKRDGAKKDDDALVQLREDIYETQIAALQVFAEKAHKDGATSFTLLLGELAADHDEDPRLHYWKASGMAQADGLTSMDDKKDEREKVTTRLDEIFAALDRVVELSGPDEVARFFGAKEVPAPGDKEARDALDEAEKKMAERRDRLFEAALLRADVMLNTGRTAEARAALLEARRWGSADAKELAAQQYRQFLAEGLLGLALEELGKRLEKDPLDKKLRERRIELLTQLGWHRQAERAKLKMRLDEARTRPWL